jgi:lipopolysaccharide export LptBFGC system permease protein LptF
MMEVFILLIFIFIISFIIGIIGNWLIPDMEDRIDKKAWKEIRANFESEWAAKLEREKNLEYEPLSDKQLKIIRANFESEWAAKLERENK